MLERLKTSRRTELFSDCDLTKRNSPICALTWYPMLQNHSADLWWPAAPLFLLSPPGRLAERVWLISSRLEKRTWVSFRMGLPLTTEIYSPNPTYNPTQHTKKVRRKKDKRAIIINDNTPNTHTRTKTDRQTHTHTHTHTHTQTYAHTQSHAWPYTQTHANTHRYTDKRTHKH